MTKVINMFTTRGKKSTALIFALCVVATVVYVSFSYEIYLPWSGARESLSSLWESLQSLSSNAYWIKRTTDQLDLPPELDSVNKSGRYVSACKMVFHYGGRTGNQLSILAAMLHVARLTGRRVAVPHKLPVDWIDKWFQVSVTRVHDVQRELCPCAEVKEALKLSYEKSVLSLPNRTDLVGKSLLICGNFQSWKYTFGVEAQLRRHLRPRANVSKAVRAFFDSSRPTRWPRYRKYVKVGVHIRAGDNIYYYNFGYTIPKQPYFEKAMTNVTYDIPLDGDKRRIQFFVTSDSIEWIKETLNLTSIGSSLNSSTTDIEVTYAFNHSAGFDLIMLTMCDVIIMTGGTYGWWGAWLSKASKVIYYYNWPRPSTELARLFTREDYYPPNWISFQGPHFTF